MSLTVEVIPYGGSCYEMVSNGSKGRVKEAPCPYWSSVDNDDVCVGRCKYLGTDDLKLKWSDLFHKKKACNIHKEKE